MSLIYAGIDEAGYGPMLGPLCVGLAVFRVRDWSPGRPAPDLWRMLSPAVVRTPKEASKGGVPVGDSKRLKLSNQSATRHPLTHLERGIMAFLHARHPDLCGPAHDADLFSTLGVNLGDSPWYSGDQAPLPCTTTLDRLRIDAAQLHARMARAGVQLLDLRVLTVDEPAFNRVIAERRSKAAILENALEHHLRAVLAMLPPECPLRMVADRHGGRTHYGDVLGRVFGTVEPQEESARASRYRLDHRHAIIMQPEAEDAHLPVALASMAAKFVRELAMARFNRYWSSRVPGVQLKPTAGYVRDARRWLGDMRAVLSAGEREAMVRKA